MFYCFRHCTSFGVSKLLKLKTFELPPDLHKALKNNLIEHPHDSQLCKNYVQLINNLSYVKKIKPEHYLILFKILIYMEAYEKQLIMASHNLKNQLLTKVFDTFCINVPTLNTDNAFVTFGDIVKLQNVRSKRAYFSRITDIEKHNIYVSLLRK